MGTELLEEVSAQLQSGVYGGWSGEKKVYSLPRHKCILHCEFLQIWCFLNQITIISARKEEKTEK